MRKMMLVVMTVMGGCDAPLEFHAPEPACVARVLQASCGAVPVCAAPSAECGEEGQDCCAESGARQSGTGVYCAAGLACNEWRRCVPC